ncbi:MAG: MFS transporter [bacterium]|nr:MFS transporter [bacterium]
MKTKETHGVLAEPKLGLKENWKQFFLLVLINAFVGGMVGMERSILPQIAVQEFALSAKLAVLSFIVVFGLVKAFTNLLTGTLANLFGRKKLLVMGWVIAIPIPFMLMFAPSWNWIVAANVLLGINQGLAWSSTVLMKIDLVGSKQRGLAMGLNEFAGYLSIALVAFFTGYIATEYGLRPYPFYIGIGLLVLGLLASIFLVKDTHSHAILEGSESTILRSKNVFWTTTWTDKNLSSITQAGLVNNLNDGMVWGIFPMVLIAKGFDLTSVGIIVGIYPAVWGIGQLFTGFLADRICKKKLLFLGMLLQAISILFMPGASLYWHFELLAFGLGIGTALVYPTFLAGIAEQTHPIDRPKSMGVFRFWRDLGYAVGALITGVISDIWNLEYAILFIGLITLASSFLIKFRMQQCK